MPVCPLCEHTQEQGNTCDQCGKLLFAERGSDVGSELVPGLEPTQVASSDLSVPGDEVLDLMPTRLASGGEGLPLEPVDGLEATRRDDAGPVTAEAVSDLDRGREGEDGPGAATPVGPRVCRYCKNEQADGALCDRCGMRLPPRAGPAGAPAQGDVDGWVICQKCGTRARPGRACGQCGIWVSA